MIEIKRLPEFDEWLDGIKDNMTRIRLNRRLDKVQRGNWGDIKLSKMGLGNERILRFWMENVLHPTW
jgi:putative addiction module killer protein